MLNSVKSWFIPAIFLASNAALAQIIIIPDEDSNPNPGRVSGGDEVRDPVFSDSGYQKKSVGKETIIVIDDSVSKLGKASSASAVDTQIKMGRTSGIALEVPSKNGSGSTQTVFISSPKSGDMKAASSSKMAGDKNLWESWFYRDQNFFDTNPYLSYEFRSSGDNGEIFNQNWGEGGPKQLNYQSDDFGLYLAKNMVFEAGCYTVSTTSDDGSAAYLNNTIILDNWADQPATTKKVYLQVLRPSYRLFQVLFYENGGAASLKVNREYHGNVDCKYVINKPDPIIPPTPTVPPKFTGWKSEFFSWKDIAQYFYTFGDLPLSSQALDLSRRVAGPINMENLNIDSKVPSPYAFIIADDYWAGRFETTMFSDSKNNCFNFIATVDDGIRLKVDGNLVIDDWNEWSRRTLTNNVLGTCLNLGYGNHQVVVEYIEKTGDSVLQVRWEKAWAPEPVVTTGNAQISLPYLGQWSEYSPCWAKIDRIMNNGAHIAVPQIFPNGSTNPGNVWANNGQRPLIANVQIIPGTVGFEVVLGKGADTWEYTRRQFSLNPGTLFTYDQSCY